MPYFDQSLGCVMKEKPLFRSLSLSVSLNFLAPTSKMQPTEGLVRFASMPDVSFRYTLRETQDGEPEIWMENRKTREQW